jgi:sulfate adenylyltransferase
VPHRAHEYLQRVALELCDGLFIQPLVGRKKRGDYTPEAVLGGYKALITNMLPRERVLLGVLSTAMRYAGPREAIFHAIIRRNYGCTHFIIGRDHAGVQSFYGKYDAHALAKKFAAELGITILALHGPFHCRICDGIATEKTCPHIETQPDAVTEISGTLMRQLLSEATMPRPELMRPEVIAAISDLPMFVEGDDV